MHGVVMELGFSKGGWGQRDNHIGWTGEVCEKCFAEYEIICAGIKQWLEKRDGIRTPRIVIDEDNVSFVRADKPPSRGRATPLLR